MKSFSLLGALGLVAAAPASEWRDRVIYQVITDRFATNGEDSNCSSLFEKDGQCTYGTFCGGTFSGLTNQLDSIKAMGFDAIWISPVVTNVDCGYTGYWATDLYSIAKEFGGEEGLKQLVNEAHSRGIYVMLDVVFNHMGHTAIDAGCRQSDFNGTGAFDAYSPFSRVDDYHLFQDQVDWHNETSVEDWWLFCLPDVNTESPRVVDLYLDWVNNLIDDFHIDALRIDTIPYVPKKFWRTLRDNITSHTFTIGEVNTGDCWSGFCPNVSWYASYQEDAEGHALDSILNYPISEVMRPAFGMDCRTATGMQVPFAPMTSLQERFQWMRGNFSDLTVLGNFVDSHDTARFLMNRNDPILLKNNLAMLFGMEGIPIVYYGTEVLMDKGAVDPDAVPGYYDPANLNRWPMWMWEVSEEAAAFRAWLTGLIALRRNIVQATDSKMVDHFVDNRTYCFLRDAALFVTYNVGSNVSELVVDQDMPVPSVWSDRAETSVCDVLAESRECLDLAGFEARFRRTTAQGWWTTTGNPQLWVPAEAATMTV